MSGIWFNYKEAQLEAYKHYGKPTMKTRFS